MIDGRGRARITDFGVAAVAREIRSEHVLAGTPAYLAPEQLKGQDASIKSDIYALGLVLYEIFTGKRGRRGQDAQRSAALPHERIDDHDAVALDRRSRSAR